MLVLSRKEGESIILYPSLEVDPDTTVAELFKGGPIRVMMGKLTHYQAQVCIEAPDVLQIARSELVTA